MRDGNGGLQSGESAKFDVSTLSPSGALSDSPRLSSSRESIDFRNVVADDGARGGSGGAGGRSVFVGEGESGEVSLLSGLRIGGELEAECSPSRSACSVWVAGEGFQRRYTLDTPALTSVGGGDGGT